jgi:hypothetical protein
MAGSEPDLDIETAAALVMLHERHPNAALGSGKPLRGFPERPVPTRVRSWSPKLGERECGDHDASRGCFGESKLLGDLFGV